MILASKKLMTRSKPACAILVRSSGDLINLMSAFANASESDGSTKIPVLLSSITSGIPPTLVATIGSVVIMASRFTNPKASRCEGNAKISLLLSN